MYQNIGGKIKALACILGWLLCIAGVITWLVLLGESAGLAWGCLIGGVLSLCGSWILYGFGQLVENVQKLANTLPNTQSGTNAADISDDLPEL